MGVVDNYLPSHVASSCVLLANFIFFTDKPVWTYELQRLSGNYKPSQLEECCKLIYNLLYKNMNNMNDSSSTHKKYSNSKFWESSIYKEVARSLQLFDSPPSLIFA